MSRVTEVEVSFTTGGQIQVKKFDEQQRYEFRASARAAVGNEDTNEVIIRMTEELQRLLEPLAQAERDALIEARNRNDERARES